MKIFSGGCASELAKKVANGLNLKLSECELSRFANGENKVWFQENCENEDVIIFQNFSSPVDQNIMQFCLMVDAASRMNPKSIVGVVPWLGYAKQDKVFRVGEPLAADVVAKIVSSLKLDKLFLLDIHHPNIKNFFTIPVEELTASDIFIDRIKNQELGIKNNKDSGKWCVIAPDVGAFERNKFVAEKLNLPLFQINKQRDLETGKVTINKISYIGHPREGGDPGLDSRMHGNELNFNISGQSVLMFDDMILSGGTMVKDAEYLKSLGALDIYFFATHLDPTSETFSNLEKAPVKQIIVTDSLSFEIPENLKNKIMKISSSPLYQEKLRKFYS
jgi:ribose-phosphate pyrophosphokinase